MTRPPNFFLLTLAGAVYLIAAAADAADHVEEVVVVESHLNDEAYEVGTQISVSAAKLDSVAPADPEQLLRRLPGIAVFRPGGPGGVSEVFVRGAEANFTAVLVDGVRLNDPANTRGGSFDFSMLAARDIAGIDIATGAMSAIYGSDAMAGVIRVHTRWPEAGQGLVYAEAGTENDWRIGAAGGLALGDELDFGLRASATDMGNEVDGATQDVVNLASRVAGRWANGDEWRVALRYADRERTTFPEASGGPQLAVLRNLQTADGDQLALSAVADWSIAENWQAEVIASWARIQDDTNTPAIAPGMFDPQPAFTTLSDYRRTQVLVINRLEINANKRLAFGLDLVDEQGRDDGTIDLGFAVLPTTYQLDRAVTSGFVELGQRWGSGIDTSLAARLDHASEETRVSGKFGASRALARINGRLWIRVANGFKFPSFFALGNPLVGNPELKTEKATNLELGYDQSLANGSELGFSVFANRYKDLIDFDFESFTNVNRSSVDIQGIEARWSMAVSQSLSLAADATWIDIAVANATGTLPRRPERTGGINLVWAAGSAWMLDGAARYVGRRVITSIPTGELIDDAFVRVDLTLRHTRDSGLSWWLAVDNALDASYQDSPGFPAPGFRVRLGAEFGFQ